MAAVTKALTDRLAAACDVNVKIPMRGRADSQVRLAGDAVFMGLDLLCLWRTASGERFTTGSLAIASRIERDGRLLWHEQGRIEGGSRLLDSPVGLRGQPVTGTLLVAAEGIDTALLEACRAVQPAVGEGGRDPPARPAGGPLSRTRRRARPGVVRRPVVGAPPGAGRPKAPPRTRRRGCSPPPAVASWTGCGRRRSTAAKRRS